MVKNRPARVSDVRDLTLSGEEKMNFIMDLHLHTAEHSACSAMPAPELLETAAALGLDGIAMTDHGYVWPDEEINQLKDEVGIHHVVVLSGQEVTCYHEGGEIAGDFLVFGCTRSFYRPSPEELIEIVHKDGGVVIAAHPYRVWCSFLGAGDLLYKLDIDAVELHHIHHDRESVMKAAKVMQALRIPGTGGSDAHDARYVGLCVTIFKKPVRDIRTLVEEIRAGRVSARRNPHRVAKLLFPGLEP